MPSVTNLQIVWFCHCSHGNNNLAIFSPWIFKTTSKGLNPRSYALLNQTVSGADSCGRLWDIWVSSGVCEIRDIQLGLYSCDGKRQMYWFRQIIFGIYKTGNCGQWVDTWLDSDSQSYVGLTMTIKVGSWENRYPFL